MPERYFTLMLSAQQCLHYYSGEASTVVTRGEDGKRIAFPVSRLVPFMTREGIRGRFRITYTHDHRFVRLTQVQR